MSEDSVNSQVTDAITQANTIVLGQSPVQAQAMLDLVMAETVGMSMYNAVTNQQNSKMTANAAITSACTKLLSISSAAKPPAEAPSSSFSASDSPNPQQGQGKELAQISGGNSVSPLKKKSLNEKLNETEGAVNELIDEKKDISKMEGKFLDNLAKLVNLAKGGTSSSAEGKKIKQEEGKQAAPLKEEQAISPKEGEKIQPPQSKQEKLSKSSSKPDS